MYFHLMKLFCLNIRRTGWSSESYSPYDCILEEVG